MKFTNFFVAENNYNSGVSDRQQITIAIRTLFTNNVPTLSERTFRHDKAASELL